MEFNSIDEILIELKNGRPVIIVDDEDRENEGDFLIAAELITKEWVHFFSKIGKGLICTPISETVSKKLNLPLMIPENNDNHHTAFTITVDAKENIGSGISSSDRAQTIKKLSQTNSTPTDFVRPGHVFPLIAKSGGIFTRRGHTEAAIDLMKLANLNEVAVLCEILNDEGETAKLIDLLRISKKFDIKISSVEMLFQYLSAQNVEINQLH